MLSVRNWDNGKTVVLPAFCGGGFVIGGDNNFYGRECFILDRNVGWAFVMIGKVSGLGSIKHIPYPSQENGWTISVAVEPGYGYIGGCITRNGNELDTTFVRIYVVDYITSATSGGIIGYTIKYQSPFNP
jgi:hypothetical protein